MLRALRHLTIMLALVFLAGCIVVGGRLPREALAIPRGVTAGAAGATGPIDSLPVAKSPEATEAASPTALSVAAQIAPASTSTATTTATPTNTVTPTTTATPTATSTPMATPTPSATATHTVTAPLAPTRDGESRSVRVPILMYHHISQPPPGADIYRKDLSVVPERLESHLRHLRDAGYHVVTLDDVLYFLTTGLPLPPKPVVLTFDDGYVDNYAHAFPLLKQYGMVGHFFIITDFVDAMQPGYMNWPQIEEMSAAGQLFGAHSRNHADLSGRDVAYLVWHALGNLENVQQHLGYHPRWIAYPSGSFDARTTAVFKSANYWGGLSTQQGATHTLDDIFELKRIRVRGRHTAEDLEMLLNIDW